jgi:ribonuclease HI
VVISGRLVGRVSARRGCENGVEDKFGCRNNKVGDSSSYVLGGLGGNGTKKHNWKSVISDGENTSGGEDDSEVREGGYRPGSGDGVDKESKVMESSNNHNNHTTFKRNSKKPNTNNLLTGVQYLINSSVLFTREHLKAGGRIDDVARLVCKSTIARIAHLAPSILTNSSLPGNHFSEEDLKKFAKKIKSFGASGKRTQEQTTAAAAHAAELVKSLPRNSTQIWTDGSMLGSGKRGPAGAGVMITKTGSNVPTHLLQYHLGEGTNQLGEIWAIGGALETMIADMDMGNVNIHIFTDSEYAIKCITGGYASRTHYNIIKHIIALLRLLPRNAVKFHHIAGHAGIPGNETADGLAKAGALHSKRELISIDLPYIAATYGFNHQLISSNCNCSSNNVCSTCSSNSCWGRYLAVGKRDSAPQKTATCNSRNVNCSSSNDDLQEELVLPNVFRDSLSIFN